MMLEASTKAPLPGPADSAKPACLPPFPQEISRKGDDWERRGGFYLSVVLNPYIISFASD